MSTDKQIEKPTIEELLDSLADESLKRSHNSLNISFKQMLAYIDKVREPISQEDIQFLLKTYRAMAETFYTQYEHSLLMEIAGQKAAKQHADEAIKSIEGLRDRTPAKMTLSAMNSLLAGEGIRAGMKYEELTKDFPVLLQYALDKLRNEWKRLDDMAVASQALIKNEKHYRAIKAVGEVAAHFVGVDAEWTVIIPGNSFALYFFTYLENFAVLTVPIHSLHAPWEWSIFWHELAGYKVRQLKKNSTIDAVKEKLSDIYDFSKGLDRSDKKFYALLNSLTLNNPFGWNYLYELFGIQRLNLVDLGGFENQFERVLIELLSKETLHAYDRIKEQGWCVGWYEELFEDAWSVLAIGEPFLKFFADILLRNSAKDNRHPPAEVRLRVAREILRLQDPEGQMKDEPRAELIEEITAKQILRFITLLVAASRKYNKTDKQDPQVYVQSIRDELFAIVKKEIQSSINSWSDEFLSANNPALKAKNSAKKFLEIFSDDDLVHLLSSLDKREIGQIKPSYRDLFKNRNYKQLLEIPFYEADFGVSTVLDVFYKTNKVFVEAKLSSVPTDVVNGNVRYLSGESPRHTSIDFWNVAAAPDFKIPP